MAKTDKFFELLARMERSDWGKIHAGMPAGADAPAYKELFDAAVKFRVSSDAELKSKISNPAILKNYAALKRYLYRAVIWHLTDSADDAESIAMTKLNELNLLIKKGIYQSACDLVNEIMIITTKHECFEIQLKVIQAARLILLEKMAPSFDTWSFESLAVTEANILDAIRRRSMMLHIYQHAQKVKNDDAALAGLKSRLKELQNNITGLKEDVVYRMASFEVHKYPFNHQEALHFARTSLALCDENTFILQDAVIRRFYIMAAFQICVFDSSVPSFGSLLTSVPDICTRGKIADSAIYAKSRELLVDLTRFTSTGTLQIFEPTLQEKIRVYEKFRLSIRSTVKSVIDYHFAYVYLMHGDLYRAKKWFLKVDSESKGRPILRGAAKLLLLFIALEEEDYFYLETQLPATVARLKTCNFHNNITSSLISHFTTFLRSDLSSVSKLDTYHKMNATYMNLVKEEVWLSTNKIFQFGEWLNCRLQNVLMKDVISNSRKQV